MNKNKFKIGECVRFKAYEREPIKNEDFDIIGYTAIIPNMVILEVISDKNAPIYNELLGIKKSNGIKYKCSWYHKKSSTFKDSIFEEMEIEKNVEIGIEDKREWESMFDKGVNDIKAFGFISKLNITGYYDYEPPIMLLIDIILNKEKSTFDSETKEPLRQVAKYLAKCKWYNPKENKFSEHLFPLEALENAVGLR